MGREISKESVPGIHKGVGPAHGWTVVGLVRVQLTNTKLSDIYKGVTIVADPDNTATVFIGRNSVTADKDVDTGGMPLKPEASIEIPIEDSTLQNCEIRAA